MPNVAAVLKAETIRLAKKEAKAATSQLKKASVQHRSDLAKLKKQIGQQAKELAYLKKQLQKQQGQAAPEEAGNNVRFSARSVKAQRKRLGLSALNYGKLVGVAGLTIYNWESGKSRPRKSQLAYLAAVRGIGKKEAVRRLAELEQAAAKEKGGRRRKKGKK